MADETSGEQRERDYEFHLEFAEGIAPEAATSRSFLTSPTKLKGG